MNKLRTWPMVLLLVLAGPAAGYAYPGGGGGVEYVASIETSAIARLGLPTGGMLDLPSGAARGVGGFGYAVNRRGWKFGGFGTFLYVNGLSLYVPHTTTTVTQAFGGIGGLISGGHGRIGPLDLSINCRLGVGGLVVSAESAAGGYGTHRSTSGVIGLYGSLDGEVGLHLFPAMMVSFFTGVDGIAPIPYGDGLTVLPAPVVGIRLTWGDF